MRRRSAPSINQRWTSGLRDCTRGQKSPPLAATQMESSRLAVMVVRAPRRSWSHDQQTVLKMGRLGMVRRAEAKALRGRLQAGGGLGHRGLEPNALDLPG